MEKKRHRRFLGILLTVCMVATALFTGALVTATPVVTPVRLYHTAFEGSGTLFNDTALWINSAQSNGYTTTPGEVIGGTKSYKFGMWDNSNWTNFIGTSANEIAMTGGRTIFASFKYKVTDISEFSWKARNATTDALIQDFYFNAATGEYHSGGGAGDYVNTQVGDYRYVRIRFTAPAAPALAYLTFASFATGANPTLIMEDFMVYADAEDATMVPGGETLLLDESFEDGYGKLTSAFDVNLPDGPIAKMSYSEGNVLNGTASVKAGYTYAGSAPEWCGLMVADPAPTLVAGATYTVQLRYRVLAEPASYFFVMLKGSDWTLDRYLAFDGSGTDFSFSSGVVNSRIDTVGDAKVLTVTFDTADTGSLTNLQINTRGGGSLLIDDVRLTRGTTAAAYSAGSVTSLPEVATLSTNDFEDATDGPYYWTNGDSTKSGTVVYSDAARINGRYSYLLTAKNDATWSEPLVYETAGTKTLAANTRYTLHFRYRAVTVTGCDNTSGTRFYFNMKPSSGSAYEKFLYTSFTADGRTTPYHPDNSLWSNGIDYASVTDSGDGYYDATFVMKTRDASDYTLVLGIFGSGAYIVDDIVLKTGIDLAAPTEASPTSLSSSPVFTEDFETGPGIFESWYDSTVESGALMHTTYASGAVLNGTYSFTGGYDFSTEGPEWCALAKTRSGAFGIDGGTPYTLRFRYDIADDPTGDGFFYVMLDSSDSGEDRYFGFTSAGAAAAFQSGVVYWSSEAEGDHYVMTVALQSAPGAAGYEGLTFGTKKGGHITIDDVSVVEGLTAEDAGTPSVVTPPTPSPAFSGGFEDGTDGPDFWINNDAGGAFGGEIVSTDPPKINGYYSLRIFSTLGTDWAEPYISEVGSGLGFASGRTYTVAFRFRPVLLNGPDYVVDSTDYYIMLKPADGSAPADTHQYQSFSPTGLTQIYLSNGNLFHRGIEDFQIDAASGGYFDAHFTFRTGEIADYRLMFGIRGGGSYILDDIRITEGQGYTILDPASPLAIPSPDPTTDPNPQTGDSNASSAFLFALIALALVSFLLSRRSRATRS